MSTDIREQILLRLKAILDSIDDTRSTWRDRQDVAPTDTPTLILLDGRETKRTTTRGRGHNRMPPAIMALEPQIWIQVVPPKDAAKLGVGEELSAWRIKVLNAIFKDEGLAVLQGENGELEYLGSTTDMEVGADIIGNMIIDLSLTYYFDPEDMM